VVAEYPRLDSLQGLRIGIFRDPMAFPAPSPFVILFVRTCSLFHFSGLPVLEFCPSWALRRRYSCRVDGWISLVPFFLASLHFNF